MFETFSSFTKLRSLFYNPHVNIIFGDRQCLTGDAVEEIVHGKLNQPTADDFYWDYEIIFNGFKSSRKYSNQLHILKYNFLRELYNEISELDKHKKKDLLFQISEIFNTHKNQIEVLKDLTDSRIGYIYERNTSLPDTDYRLSRILYHNNITISRNNELILVNGTQIKKNTDERLSQHISLFLEEQLKYINQILEYLGKYILGEITEELIEKEKIVIQNQIEKAKERASKYPDYLHLKKVSISSKQITQLFHFLKENRFIANDSDLVDFRRIFFGPKIENQIIWIGSPAELKCFINGLISKNKIVISDRGKWIVTSKCFLNSKQLPFKNDDIAQSKGENKQRQRLIDIAVSYIEASFEHSVPFIEKTS